MFESFQVIWMGITADTVCNGIPNLMIPKATCVSTNWMTSRHLKTTMFLKFSGSLRDHTFQNFDPLVPLGSAGFCLRRGLGPWLLRLHAAASGSRERPRRGCPTPPRGQGCHGCGEKHMWPWPRTSDGDSGQTCKTAPSLSEVSSLVRQWHVTFAFLQVSQLEPKLFHVS